MPLSGQTAVVFIDFDLRPVARRMHSDEDTIEVSDLEKIPTFSRFVVVVGRRPFLGLGST